MPHHRTENQTSQVYRIECRFDEPVKGRFDESTSWFASMYEGDDPVAVAEAFGRTPADAASNAAIRLANKEFTAAKGAGTDA